MVACRACRPTRGDRIGTPALAAGAGTDVSEPKPFVLFGDDELVLHQAIYQASSLLGKHFQRFCDEHMLGRRLHGIGVFWLWISMHHCF